MKKIILLALALLLVGMVAGANAAASYYLVTTIGEFRAENLRINGVDPIIENFNNNQLNTPGLTITEFGGAGLFQDGFYQNIVNKDANPPRFQVFNFDSMNGFGGWFDLANPGGPGSSIDVYVGADFVGNIPETYAGQFWGFFSTVPFSAVTFVEGSAPGGAQETYQIVDLAICPVPVPASLLLLGSGILGLVGIGLRRKS